VRLLLLSLVSGSAGLAGCGGGDDDRASRETIKLGILGDFSGPGSAQFQEHLRGAELAVAEINKAGGVMGRNLELVKADTRSDAEQSKIALDQVLAETSVIILPSGGLSGNSVKELIARTEAAGALASTPLSLFSLKEYTSGLVWTPASPTELSFVANIRQAKRTYGTDPLVFIASTPLAPVAQQWEAAFDAAGLPSAVETISSEVAAAFGNTDQSATIEQWSQTHGQAGWTVSDAFLPPNSAFEMWLQVEDTLTADKRPRVNAVATLFNKDFGTLFPRSMVPLASAMWSQASDRTPIGAAYVDRFVAVYGARPTSNLTSSLYDIVHVHALAIEAAQSITGTEVAAQIIAVTGGGTKVSPGDFADAADRLSSGEDIDYDGTHLVDVNPLTHASNEITTFTWIAEVVSDSVVVKPRGDGIECFQATDGQIACEEVTY
jgi:branched-chain amino acid transport system substrate-binding protein